MRGLTTPSLRSLRLVANALEIPISWLFAPGPAVDGSTSQYIVRKGARRLLHLTSMGIRKTALSPEEDGGRLEMYDVVMAPGGTSGPEFYSHRGEKAGVVLSGSMRLWLNEEPNLLSQGDSFRFPAKISHRFDNPTDKPTTVLWVVDAGIKSAKS